MKETLVTTSERLFITRCIEEGKRLDGRSLSDFRNIRIIFGNDYGSVQVSLGETRVLAQVSCEIVQPKSTRPNEGLLFINVELGPMAGPQFEPGRPSDMSVQVNRILERAFKDSRCVDLESLCIVADEKVWNLRVDLNVLNHQGNIIDCASVAVLCALAHFKRPDVTTSGDEFIIHTHAEKDPIPIPLHHYPVCISYAIYGDGSKAVADPTAIEERVSEANLVFGLNSYKELCGLHLGGVTLTSSQLLLQCAGKASERATLVVELIKSRLEEDVNVRIEGKAVGFSESIRSKSITSLKQERLKIRLKAFDFDNLIENCEKMEIAENNVEGSLENKVVSLDSDSAVLFPMENPDKLLENKWIPEDDSDLEDEKEKKKSSKNKKHKKKIIQKLVNDSSESEEEETMLINE